MTTRQKKYSAFALAAASVALLAAFEWPQAEIESSSFYSYFGQLRGGTISSSLVFTDSDEIKAADSGRVIVAISEHDESSCMFESTLGNAVVIAHKDNMLTVYANLSADEQEMREELTQVEAGADLGTCSNSGWQEGQGCLEFQVLDTQDRSFVNPRVLMPRFGEELELSLRGITAVSKKGAEYTLGTQRVVPSGMYYVYKQRQDKAVPYSTTVYVNGLAVQTIPYDRLVQIENRLCTSGAKNYSVQELYPDSRRMLLGEIMLPKGRNTVSFVAVDIIGNETSIAYTVEAR
ncbi:MAG: M23 family metallopeptidase [Treponema sp.]|nr:M23 family metallopeptidase [Treponema sp.]